MTKATANAVADWRACKAVEFYRKADIDLYCRHIAMCDAMRRVAEYLP